MSTDLATTATKLATTPGATIGSFLSGLAAVDSKKGEVTRPIPEVPAVTSGQRDALTKLPDLIKDLRLPSTARELEPAEEKAVADVLHAVSEINKLIKNLRDDALRAALFNHLDRVAEREGTVGPDTPVNKDGYYLVSGEGPGYAREYRSGTPAADVEKLEALVAEGVIERKDFLSMTKPARVIDEGGFLKYVAKNPAKLPALRRAIRYVRAASVSLTVK